MPDPGALDPWFTTSIEIRKIVIGGIIAATATLIFNGRRQDRELERAAGHLATRLIDIFERYNVACADVRGDNLRNYREDPYD